MIAAKALTRSEVYKIQCAQKYFEALGIEAKINYFAPVKEYKRFRERNGDLLNE